MNLLDRTILLFTGLAALYLAWHSFVNYRKPSKPTRFYIYYLIAFSVLLVAGLLLILLGYGVLESPWVVVVAALIPLGLSLGLVAEFYPKFEKLYLVFAAIGVLAITVTRFTGPAGLATIALIVWHATAGLLIFGLPVALWMQRRTDGNFLAVTLGGALIGLGGIALAFLKTGRQLLFFSPELVFAILAPLLLAMTLAFAWGFVKSERAV